MSEPSEQKKEAYLRDIVLGENPMSEALKRKEESQSIDVVLKKKTKVEKKAKEALPTDVEEDVGDEGVVSDLYNFMADSYSEDFYCECAEFKGRLGFASYDQFLGYTIRKLREINANDKTLMTLLVALKSSIATDQLNCMDMDYSRPLRMGGFVFDAWGVLTMLNNYPYDLLI